MSGNEVIANPIVTGSVVRVRPVAVLAPRCPIRAGDVGVIIRIAPEAFGDNLYEIRTLHRPYEPRRWWWLPWELEVLQEPET